MKVADLLVDKGSVETIRPDATVLVAVHRMRMQHVGALVVSRDGAKELETNVLRDAYLTRH